MVLSFINEQVFSIISDGTYRTIYSTAAKYIFCFHIFLFLKEPTVRKTAKNKIQVEETFNETKK